ncbi:TPA: oligosaccharide repeat unit polymerase [Candidatus Poribacteria bacterium]|nr:oligosaccharide repeat unit polymerase [Candidatus Poribacteria bacterium]
MQSKVWQNHILLVLFIFLVIGLVLLSDKLVNMDSATHPLIYSLFFNLSILSIILFIPPVYQLWKGKFDLFESINVFIIIYFFMFVLFPLYGIWLGRNWYRRTTNYYSSLNLTTIYAIAGVIFFYIGYFLRLGKRIAHILPSFADSWSKKKLNTMVIAYFLMSCLALFVFITNLKGGLSGLKLYLMNDESYNRWYMFHGTGWGYFVRLMLFFPIAYLLWYSNTLEKINKTILEKTFSICLFCFALFCSVASSLARGSVLLLVLTMAVQHHYLKSRDGIRYVKWNKGFLKYFGYAFIGTILVINFMTFAARYRIYYSVKGLEAFTSFESSEDFIGMTLSPFASSSGFLLVLEDVSRTKDYQWGKTYLNLFLMQIPRLVWRRKPRDLIKAAPHEYFSRKILRRMGVTATPTLLAELYWNFSWPGILIGCFLFGLFCRSAYEFLKANHTNKAVIMIYSAIIWVGIIKTLRGGFYGGIGNLTRFLIPAIIAIEFISVNKKSRFWTILIIALPLLIFSLGFILNFV